LRGRGKETFGKVFLPPSPNPIPYLSKLFIWGAEGRVFKENILCYRWVAEDMLFKGS
jgi:hypothetical protein